MTPVPRRRLGASGIEVSELSLGSWRTFERIPRESGIAVMQRARELGINFLDDARYNDETGTAPMKSGYSEVVFGELFRSSGWKRQDVVLANKLWWEFWPEENAAAELEGSLRRMNLEYFDVVYAESPPDGLYPDEIVRQIGRLISDGKIRTWGVLNWSPALIAQAGKICLETDVPPPSAAQLAYSLVRRSPVEDQEMIDALDGAGTSVVSSFTLDGGALTGKYAEPGAQGRLSNHRDDQRYAAAFRASVDLAALAREAGVAAAPLALAFALLNPRVASVLFGASRAVQVSENVKAVELASSLDAETKAKLQRIGDD